MYVYVATQVNLDIAAGLCVYVYLATRENLDTAAGYICTSAWPPVLAII